MGIVVSCSFQYKGCGCNFHPDIATSRCLRLYAWNVGVRGPMYSADSRTSGFTDSHRKQFYGSNALFFADTLHVQQFSERTRDCYWSCRRAVNASKTCERLRKKYSYEADVSPQVLAMRWQDNHVGNINLNIEVALLRFWKRIQWSIHRRLQSCVGTRARLGYAAFDAQLRKAA